MARLIALYKKPADAAAFDRHYVETHIPLAKKLPGLRKYEVSTDGVSLLGSSSSPYHLVAILHFDSSDAIMKALGTAEGQAAAGDLGNFAQAGCDLLVFDTKEV